MEILEYIGKVTYQYMMLIIMDQICSVFHVSSQCNYNSDLTHVLRVEDVVVEDDMIYNECLVQILDGQVK